MISQQRLQKIFSWEKLSMKMKKVNSFAEDALISIWYHIEVKRMKSEKFPFGT